MLKALLLIHCDGCHQLFPFSCMASDNIAWQVDGDILVQMACNDRWTVTQCGNFHYCPVCDHELGNRMYALTQAPDAKRE